MRNETKYIVQRQVWEKYGTFAHKVGAVAQLKDCESSYPKSKFRIIKQTTTKIELKGLSNETI